MHNVVFTGPEGVGFASCEDARGEDEQPKGGEDRLCHFGEGGMVAMGVTNWCLGDEDDLHNAHEE